MTQSIYEYNIVSLKPVSPQNYLPTTLSCMPILNPITIFRMQSLNLPIGVTDCQLRLAPDKCFTCCVRSRSRKNHKPSHYFINSQQLTQVPLIRDLGVYIDEVLTFVPHIKTVIQKASARARLINLSFTSKDKTILIKAFCMYVRLEYCLNTAHKSGTPPQISG